jgi:hypothetical protein
MLLEEPCLTDTSGVGPSIQTFNFHFPEDHRPPERQRSCSELSSGTLYDFSIVTFSELGHIWHHRSAKTLSVPPFHFFSSSLLCVMRGMRQVACRLMHVPVSGVEVPVLINQAQWHEQVLGGGEL